MKRGIELNGIANIQILLNSPDNGFVVSVMNDTGAAPHVCVRVEDMKEIKEQLKLLERYMIAYCQAVNAGTPAPHWHEVRDNPTKYPDNRESSGE